MSEKVTQSWLDMTVAGADGCATVTGQGSQQRHFKPYPLTGFDLARLEKFADAVRSAAAKRTALVSRCCREPVSPRCQARVARCLAPVTRCRLER